MASIQWLLVFTIREHRDSSIVEIFSPMYTSFSLPMIYIIYYWSIATLSIKKNIYIYTLAISLYYCLLLVLL